MSEQGVVGVECGTDRTSAVAGSRLHIELVDRRLAHDAAVGDAVQCHASRHAQAFESRLLVDRSHHGEHDFLGDLLDARGDVGVVLVVANQLVVVSRLGTEVARISGARREEVEPRLAGRTEELEELLAVPGVARVVVREVVHVEAERAVGRHLDQLPHLVDVSGLAVRRHAHDLVFALVDLEAEKGREDAVEQPE